MKLDALQAPTEDSRAREELIAENERLRRELLRKRTRSPMWPAVAALAAHILLRPLLDPWLNASDDAKVGAAVAILAVPIVFAIVTVARSMRAKTD